ncbi:hypothetical protein [Tahibacter caeni]|uniref:hypothetical protein n=1 Tax=Tahibacter caeni TaxID=1453545 RepID=UPI0021496ABC|nr:hypothetical protein [Tahibacter caeni]
MSPTRLLLSAGLVLLVAGWFARDTLPAPPELSPLVREEPRQTPTDPRAFAVRAGGIDYRIEPVFDYDIAGLVVSQHDSETWWDTIHADANDHLNVADLCLVWGANAVDGVYRQMKFHNAQFTCYMSYPGGVTVTAADLRAVSNNHLLTADAGVARAIRRLRIGDQVRLRGRLASYSHNTGFAFHRGTSVSRDDIENGACETIFVDSLDLLASAPAWPRWLFRCGALLLLAGLVAWYRTPFGARDR